MFFPRPTSGAHYFFAQNPGLRPSNVAGARLRAYPGLTTPTLFEGHFAAQYPYHDVHCWKDIHNCIRSRTTGFYLLVIPRIVGCQAYRHGLYFHYRITSLATVRAKLIRKGMVYSPAHGEIAFTVPLFDEFLIRAIPKF